MEVQRLATLPWRRRSVQEEEEEERKKNCPQRFLGVTIYSGREVPIRQASQPFAMAVSIHFATVQKRSRLFIL